MKDADIILPAILALIVIMAGFAATAREAMATDFLWLFFLFLVLFRYAK